MFNEAVDRVGSDLRFLVGATRRGDVAVGDLYAALGAGRAVEALASVWVTETARQIARRERHGDGGAGVLRERVGVSSARARRRVSTARTLDAMPQARRAVDDGEVSAGNAQHLALAARRVAPEAVEADEALLSLARELPADRFAREADSWSQKHSGDHGRGDYLRKRRRRHLKLWDKDGMTHLRGLFDPESGARIRGSIEQVARQLRRADRQQTREVAKPGHNAGTGGGGAGALEGGGAGAANHRIGDVSGDVGTVAHGGGGGQGLGAASVGAANAADPGLTGGSGLTGRQQQRSFGQLMADALDLLATGAGNANGAVGGRRKAEVVVVADLEAVTGDDPSGRCEIPGSGPIPPEVLQRLLCDAELTGILFHKGQPLHHGATVRTATKAQRRALIARDRGCVGCGAPPKWCEAHHTIPFSLSRRTTINELALVCWRCHQNIHNHNWQITNRNGALTLHPPHPNHRQPNHTQRRPPRKPPNPTPRPKARSPANT